MWFIYCLIFCEILKFLLLCDLESEHFYSLDTFWFSMGNWVNCTDILGIPSKVRNTFPDLDLFRNILALLFVLIWQKDWVCDIALCVYVCVSPAPQLRKLSKGELERKSWTRAIVQWSSTCLAYLKPSVLTALTKNKQRDLIETFQIGRKVVVLELKSSKSQKRSFGHESTE